MAVVDEAEICELLLEAEADIYMTDMYGRTALHIAAMYGSTSVISMLLEVDALKSDVSQENSLPFLRDLDQRPALFLAGFHRRMQAVDILYDVSPYTPRTNRHCHEILDVLRHDERKKIFLKDEEKSGVQGDDSSSTAESDR